MDRRQLLTERDYLTDRLSEIGIELKRLIAEGDGLKTELEGLPEGDVNRARIIRRRRTYIRRHSEELKVEREKVIVERNELIRQLQSDESQQVTNEEDR